MGQTYLLAFSGVISMIGSLLVAFTWAYPKSNRVKHGRILLFWLSVSDFMSALFYFLSAFHNENDSYCQALALLDMFFPMASFIWTDIIAYYLYLVVKTRSSKTPYDWPRLLVNFHILAWGVSALFVIIVAAAGQAGKNSADDDGLSNTGGWCWIKNTGRLNTFLWELAGGKLVEWTSGLIIVPFLYISVACELYQIEKRNYGFNFRDSLLGRLSGRATTTIKKSPSMPSLKSEGEAIRNIFKATKRNSNEYKQRERSMSGTDSVDGGKSVKMINTGKITPTSNHADGTTMPPYRSESEGDVFSDSEMISNQLFHSEKYYEGYESTKSFNSQSHLSERESEVHNPMSPKPIDPESSNPISSIDKERTTSTQSNGKYFTKFYMKLALLPIVFIFIRLWSSLKVILIAVDSPDAGNEVLDYFLTFFDPSQGFFNAVLFVLFSKNDRIELVTNLKQIFNDIFCCSKNSKKPETLIQDIESNAQIFKEEGLATTNKLRDKLMQNQTMGNVVSNSGEKKERSESKDEEFLQIDDLSDFECDDENRLSNFSFDSRMESVPAPASSFSNNIATSLSTMSPHSH